MANNVSNFYVQFEYKHDRDNVLVQWHH